MYYTGWDRRRSDVGCDSLRGHEGKDLFFLVESSYNIQVCGDVSVLPCISCFSEKELCFEVK